jgi:hypothetical protein
MPGAVFVHRTRLCVFPLGLGVVLWSPAKTADYLVVRTVKVLAVCQVSPQDSEKSRTRCCEYGVFDRAACTIHIGYKKTSFARVMIKEK